jgi:hypothetical protein
MCSEIRSGPSGQAMMAIANTNIVRRCVAVIVVGQLGDFKLRHGETRHKHILLVFPPSLSLSKLAVLLDTP